ncbi:7-cyano-7-deazaguanine synthase QueC [Halomonas sp. MCCC 1A17488]|uniref:7-cyano-7-deazaguanine synthase n=1 Tax=Billgrantia sulfidoxydans TaxID=2733484 RepID=A0ABX7W3Q1_9GAMM|nr:MULTISPECIES: 7-cyano-7-deazaguanine synthase QueC [Halomonas]MCE8015312.1 7-cyano-7-deazaguanine synthase QueC [Halomonas sp. MCCC 1A17488]MCG3238645.1 7-cyano-7-deazaguanine synthase QueC [Halomonas sp. MCCC 1A17488]QPP51380.1 7-cyano-7-deazaguanine synthase QueC [Halomonas sp. SS10-MC5]QTP54931.1 7-cyano-7-deazaguanine synthase QueC [Halomonas sulfidoxydans]
MPPISSPSATVVIYSGGMDSFTVLHRALRAGLEVHALSFDYGQRHARELEVAACVCAALGVPHQVVDIRAIHGLIDNSALTDASRDMPEGDYGEENLTATVVPNRNMILLSLAIAKAVNVGAGRVDYGAHGGDHVLYPDCRPEFVEAMGAVAGIANFAPVEIHAPFLRSSKAEILADGLAMGLDYAETWTCYRGEALACGRCGSCRERLAAFAANGVSDPLAYAADAPRPDLAGGGV